MIRISRILRSFALPPIAMAGLLYSMPTAADQSSIDGSYRFIQRILPDGTVVRPPQVLGSATYSNGQRNVNVLHRDEAGKLSSTAIVSTYTLTSAEFTETLQFLVVTDQATGKPPIYVVSGPAKSVSVRSEDWRIEFKPPYGKPSLVFEGDRMTATLEGEWIDLWEKVK